MKRFLLKTLLLALLSAGITAVLALFAYAGHVSKRFGPEVFEAIRTCTSTQPMAQTLVLGDSVAYQVFGVRPKPSVQIAVGASNAAVTPLGNRILLDRWLSLNPQTKSVVYLVHPTSLANDGNPKFTFHYLLFPFAETGLFENAPPKTLDHLRRRFGRLPVDNTSVRHLLYRNDRLYGFYERHLIRRPVPVSGGGLPEIVVANLRAMRDACAARGVRFRIAFPPVRADNRPSKTYLARISEQLRDICPEIDDEVANLRVEPPEHFRDGVHYSKKWLDENRERLRAVILAGFREEHDPEPL